MFDIPNFMYACFNRKPIHHLISKLLSASIGKAVDIGTHEAALLEAQGGRILKGSGQPFNHLESLRASRSSLYNIVSKLDRRMLDLYRKNYDLASQLHRAIGPLQTYARIRLGMVDDTLKLAAELRQKYPNRLSWVVIQAPQNAWRTRDILVSNVIRTLSTSNPNVSRTLIPSILRHGLGHHTHILRNLYINTSLAVEGIRMPVFQMAQNFASLIRSGGASLSASAIMWFTIGSNVIRAILDVVRIALMRVGGAFTPIIIFPAVFRDPLYEPFGPQLA
ncbi:hypothetical protein AAD018_017310 [Aestuariibius insulae]|uniref:hypothetical protein n=1 Tax=Aestuariibius insulae TaxID=2058287 RepID=UPI00345E749C